MLGDLIGEASGRITGAKVLELSGDRPRIEVSFQGQGKLGGTATTEIGTYWQEIRPGGTFYGEGGPLIMTEDGELVSWKGFGVGKPTGPGFAASFGVCGAMQTSSERHAHLNGVASVGEYEVDSEGNYSWRLWEWKVAGA